jgi:hypothetical protein
VNNLNQDGPELYITYETRPRQLKIVPRTVKFGVTGQV